MPAADDTGSEPTRKRRGEPFFQALSLALLATVIGGFSSSFYFRSDSAPPLSSYLFAHGVILTLWYVLIVVQASLLSAGRNVGRVRLHQRLGMSSTVIVVATVWTGIVVSVDFYRSGEGSIVVSSAALLFANLSNLVGFVTCFAAGVATRKKPQAHKRYMTWASVVIIAPATFRLLQLWGASPTVAALGQMLFVAAMFAYDILRDRRIHKPTWIGLAIVVIQMGGSFTIGNTDAWADLARALFSGP